MRLASGPSGAPLTSRRHRAMRGSETSRGVKIEAQLNQSAFAPLQLGVHPYAHRGTTQSSLVQVKVSIAKSHMILVMWRGDSL